MRILLIAYEFPPIPSPQSLRWAYLVRELAWLGHEVAVVAPDHPGYGPGGGLPAVPASVTVHRTVPGLFGWLLARLVSRRRGAMRPPAAEDGRQATAAPPAAAVTLNWKGRLFHRARDFYASRLFPDARGEWTPWARRAVASVLESFGPDVVIASHEPANTLELGLFAQRQGYRLVADLGDPVCAGYTPKRWRRRALRLEHDICEKADLVTVTSRATARLMAERHRLDPSRVHLMTQGFDGGFTPDEGEPLATMDPGRIELLYTGSFYAFRRHQALLEAVLATPGVRLNLASSVVPDAIVEVARRHPEQIRLLGFLSHRQALRIQRQADVLVNLANDDPSQVPGKIYEYLGARRPILHIGSHLDDESVELLRLTGAGRSCVDDAGAIAAVLAEYLEHRHAGSACSPPTGHSRIDDHAWSAIAKRFSQRIAPFQAPST
jgi:hypothetical protein